MQLDFLTNLAAWGFSLLVFPGLLFALLLALSGQWLAKVLLPLFMPRLYRQRNRVGSFFGPLLLISKLLGRKNAVRWQAGATTGTPGGTPSNLAENALVIVGVLAPLVALALLPLSGNPVTRQLGSVSSLLVVLTLLAVYPIVCVAVQARAGGMSSMSAVQSAGALLTGLLPTLLIVVALMQVASSHTLSINSLLSAPTNPQQTFVRLLAGLALLVVLPWWLGASSLRGGNNIGEGSTGAGVMLGRLTQTTALCAFWAVLVLPVPGDPAWAFVVQVAGTLFAALVMRLLSALWVPTSRPSEAANLVWVTTLPIAVLAFLIGLI